MNRANAKKVSFSILYPLSFKSFNEICMQACPEQQSWLQRLKVLENRNTTASRPARGECPGRRVICTVIADPYRLSWRTVPPVLAGAVQLAIAAAAAAGILLTDTADRHR